MTWECPPGGSTWPNSRNSALKVIFSGTKTAIKESSKMLESMRQKSYSVLPQVMLDPIT